MSSKSREPTLESLAGEVRLLRWLVLLLATPGLVMALNALLPGATDVITAQRFVVVDEQGVERAELAAPTRLVRDSARGQASARPVPALVMHDQEGHEVRIGGHPPQVRVQRGDRWSGFQTTGFFTVQEDEHVSASTTINPFQLSVSVSRDDLSHDISLGSWPAGETVELVVTDGEQEFVFPERR